MGRSEALARVCIGCGALAGLSAVAMAAVAAHALPKHIDATSMLMVQSALQMQGWHALALMFTGLWASRSGVITLLAGGMFATGTLLFCGAVYALALSGIHLPAVAPVGGTLLMLGWLLLGLSVFQHAK